MVCSNTGVSLIQILIAVRLLFQKDMKKLITNNTTCSEERGLPLLVYMVIGSRVAMVIKLINIAIAGSAPCSS